MSMLYRLWAALILAGLVGAANWSAIPATAAIDYLPNEIIVRLAPGLNLDAGARINGLAHIALDTKLRRLGAWSARSLGHGSDTFLVRLASGSNVPEAVRLLAAEPRVRYAQPNYLRHILRTPDDPVFEQQWSLRTMQLPEAWDITTGSPVIIAVIDTGAAADHPDLSGQVLPGYDFFNNDADPSDDNGHGTATSGLIAARSDNGEGISGVCWECKILPIKVLGNRGQGGDAAVAAGIRWASDQGARVINMSLGGSQESQVLREAIDYAVGRGALIVAATGNEAADGNPVNYPAGYENVLAVAATGNTDVVTGFSNYGSYVDVAAPGVGVWSTIWTANGNTYGPANGTSFASPHVAGIAGLVLSLRTDLNPSQLANLLRLTADDRGEPGRDDFYGYGRINALRALQAASDPSVLSRSRIQGQLTIADPSQILVTLSNGQQTRPDTSGYWSFDGLPAGLYTITVSGALNEAQQVYLDGTALSVATVSFGGGIAARGAFAPAAPRSGAAYFPETQHNLAGSFLQFWQNNGGLPVFGFPISEEFTERGEDGRDYTVQYFERHRFELHAENPPPYNVLLGRMGDTILLQQGRNWWTFEKGIQRGGCLSFDTGHVLCEPFLSAWRSQGLEFDGQLGKSLQENLALFGQPLSEPQFEEVAPGTVVLVQWFERARFEDHGTQGVLLGLLGNELARARGLR